MPKISVIIPTFNSEKFLSRTINSVINQTFTDIEIIIVDDGSTDNTKKIISDFKNKDNRIIYIWEENSGGAAKPKNKAIEIAKGEYIAYLDHDDEWFPNKLEKQYELFLKSSKNVGLISCNVLITDFVNNYEGVHKIYKYKSVFDLLNNGEKYVFSNSSIMIPRKVIEQVGFRDEKLKIFEDLDFFVRIALSGYDFTFVDDTLVHYYIYKNNLSKNFKEAASEYNIFIKKYYEILNKRRTIISSYYRHLGTFYLLSGENKINALKYFIYSVIKYPSIRNICTSLLALFGRKIYYFILTIKKKNNLNKNE